MSKFNLLFPLEIINRELDFRVFLSTMLAREDTTIHVGQHDVIHAMVPFMRGGIYIGKSVFPNDSTTETGARYAALREQDFRLLYLDEEGAVFRGEEKSWEWALGSQMDVTRIEPADYVCAWGTFQRSFYRSQTPRCASNIRVTGHPRFDLYRPHYRSYFEESVSALKKRFSPFVLVNTNLALANPSAGVDYSFSAINGWDPKSRERTATHLAEYGYLSRLVHAFASLLVKLSVEFPSTQFVLRPHPSEGLEHYKAILKDFPNVHVLHEGPVAPWIFAADALIHNGCTTGIEGILAGTKVVVYRTLESAEFDPYLPNSLGLTCRDEASAIEAVRVALRGDDLPRQAPSERALSLLANLGGGDAFADLVNVYEEARAGMNGDGSFREQDFAAHNAVRRVKQSAKNLVRPYVPSRLVGTNAIWAKAFSKMFYGFEEKDLERRFARAQRILKKRVRVRLHNSELFSVQAA